MATSGGAGSRQCSGYRTLRRSRPVRGSAVPSLCRTPSTSPSRLGTAAEVTAVSVGRTRTSNWHGSTRGLGLGGRNACFRVAIWPPMFRFGLRSARFDSSKGSLDLAAEDRLLENGMIAAVLVVEKSDFTQIHFAAQSVKSPVFVRLELNLGRTYLDPLAKSHLDPHHRSDCCRWHQ